MINEIIGSIMERIRDSMEQTVLELEKGIAEVIARIIVAIIEVIK